MKGENHMTNTPSDNPVDAAALIADMTSRRDAWREMAYALKAKEKTYNMWICCAGKLNEQDARARLRELGEII